MVGADRRLLWHPHEQTKFVVGGGSQITLYEWAAEKHEIRHVTSQQDLQFMKTFAWSPDPAFNDLFAVGLSTGRIDLLRLEATRQTRRTSGGSSVLSSGPIVSLTARNSRACNSLQFCPADPNYLAVGLDKARGDSSLVIYDILSTRSKLSLSLTEDDDPAPARPGPVIPRSEIVSRAADQRTVQHHAPTEVVSAVAYASHTNYLVLAGMSARWLRLYDIRTPVPQVTSVAAKVQGITSDPFDTHRIATFGDGYVSVWDVRKLSSVPLLTFSERDAAGDGTPRLPLAASMYNGLEFSSTRRGSLAALHRDSTFVRFWDVLSSRPTDGQTTTNEGSSDAGEGSSLSSRLTRKSWTAGLPWAAGGTTTPVGHGTSQPSLVLSDTRRTKFFSKPLSSFALVPQPSLSLTLNVMVVSKDGDLELYAVHDTPKQAVWSGRGDLVVSAGVTCRVFSGVMAGEADVEREFREMQDSAQQNQQLQQQQQEDVERSQSIATESSGPPRGRSVTSPALFGRGDEEGFPALGSSGGGASPVKTRQASGGSSVLRTGLSATRPSSGSASRTFSPASMRRYPLEMESTLPTSSSRSRSRARPEIVPPSKPPTRSRNTRGVEHVVEDDISMVMRRRCLRGYRVGNPYHNVAVTRDDDAPVPQMLSDLWQWLNTSQDFLCVPTPRIHGYDFAYRGVAAIWEGFDPIVPTSTTATPSAEPSLLLPDLLNFKPRPSSGSRSQSRTRRSLTRSYSPADDLHGNFNAALGALAMRSGERDGGVLTNSGKLGSLMTNRPLQRQLALQLCGWSLKEEDLWTNVKRWEREGSHSRAACWLVFAGHHSKAVEVLMRSNDESHQIMSGVLAALTPDTSTRNPNLSQYYERLIIKLQDPYFRALLTHLSLGDWSEVLDEEVIPFRERLSIAFQFLDDQTLSAYLHRCTRNSAQRGDIDGLMVTGLTKAGLDILQSYVNRSGDVQTAAIIASYVVPAKFRDARAERWIEAYRDLLDGFKLHHNRVWFDIDRGALVADALAQAAGVGASELKGVDWAPKQILMRCNYCNKPVVNPNAATGTVAKHKPTVCGNCSRALPRCSVCLMTLNIVPDPVRDAELMYSPGRDTIDEAILICQTCRHGGHASHIAEWFFGEGGARSRGLCPVSGCECRCAEEF
ncbi:zinc-ribbon-16 domain-containing protein [Mycena chlorophos]|uniref:Zinc-ribbon-16 domain-containing protein n=1 Tax=Mycena chlorophos TaxID=658473 RepID=A0A8H6WFW5_MYCCL|nr:zinc-ribbon-16 domain-containing protein [Mycena chlorophos]